MRGTFNMKQPRQAEPGVSVIIPTYNRSVFLAGAIQSVLDQTHGDFELIVVDDGSTDSTPELVAGYTDYRVRYIRQENRGVSGARNRGLSMARAGICAFLDSDDLWKPRLLEVLAPIFKRDREIGLVYAQSRSRLPNGSLLPVIRGGGEKFPGRPLASLLYGDFGCIQTTLVRRTCLERVGGFREEVAGREDYDLYVRLARVCRFHFEAQILAYHGVHPDQTTWCRSRRNRELIQHRYAILDQVYADHDLPEDVLAVKPLAYRNAHLDAMVARIGMKDYRQALSALGQALQAGGHPLETLGRSVFLLALYNVLSKTAWGPGLTARLQQAWGRVTGGKNKQSGECAFRKGRPILAMVSTDIRRDLLAPLAHLKGWRVRLYYRRAPYGDLTPEDMAVGPIRYIWAFELFFRLVRARPDLIQGVEPFSLRFLPCFYACHLAAVALNRPLILVALENRPLDKNGALAGWLLKKALGPVFKRAARIFTLNRGALANVMAVGPYSAKAGHLMYGCWGVDLDEFRPEKDSSEPDFGTGPIVLFVGRLEAAKGIFDLVRAVAGIRPDQPTLKLVIVGDGPAREDLEKEVEALGLGGQVIFQGIVKHRDLPGYYRAADVVATPSRTTRKWEEQVGMVNLQALACGRPVLSTSSGAIPEYVPQGRVGLLVREGEPGALLAGLQLLLFDPAWRRRLGGNGRALAERRYDARRNLALVERELTAVLEEANQ